MSTLHWQDEQAEVHKVVVGPWETCERVVDDLSVNPLCTTRYVPVIVAASAIGAR